MRDQALALIVVLAAATSIRSDGAGHRENIFSRIASRATGAVADIVDPDAIIDQVDVNALMERVDIDALLDRIDVNALMERVDVNALLDEVDVNALLDRVDPDVILDKVDVDALMERVDIDALMERVDVNALVGRVDPNVILDKVDVNALLEEVDVNAVMERVDIDALMDRVDVKELTDRAGIPEIVRESTGELAGSAMDVLRRQIVALDTIFGRALYRLTRRDPSDRPTAPPELEAATGVDEVGRGQVTGHYAGPASRLAAYAADALVIGISLMLMLLAVTYLVDTLFQVQMSADWRSGFAGVLVGGFWSFLYYFVSWALAGRTIGMALIGLRVTSREGSPVTGRQAFVRALVFPISFLLFGLGFLGIVISPERRTLHDAAAGTTVVYDWGDRPAELPAPLTSWVMRHEPDDGEPVPVITD